MLVFRVKWLSALDYKLLSGIADQLGYDHYSGLYLYRLNPIKAARIGLDRTLHILGRVNVYLPSDLREIIRSLSSEGVDVYFTLETPAYSLIHGLS